MAYPDYGISITLAVAQKCAAAAEAEAQKHGWQMVIAIVDTGGNLVLLHRMDNAHLASVTIAERKARSAVALRRDTKVVEELIAKGGLHLRLLGVEEAMTLEGGVLLIKDAKIIGGIGVSGAQSIEDGQVAMAGLAALSGSA